MKMNNTMKILMGWSLGLLLAITVQAESQYYRLSFVDDPATTMNIGWCADRSLAETDASQYVVYYDSLGEVDPESSDSGKPDADSIYRIARMDRCPLVPDRLALRLERFPGCLVRVQRERGHGGDGGPPSG